MTVNILCMRWGALYGAPYVNRLHSMVRRHLQRSFRFVCFTDDAQGLDPGIEVLPLPTVQSVHGQGDTRWRKLGVFAGTIADLSGPALFLDLDLVIVGGLDRFFDYPGEFCVVRDVDLFRTKWVDLFRPQQRRWRPLIGNTSVFRFEIGAHAGLVQRYEREAAAIHAKHPRSQEYVTEYFLEKNALQYWPREWCRSFKNECVPRGIRSYFQDPTVPEGARIVLFAGNLKQEDVLAGRGNTFYRRIGPVPWLDQVWR